MSEPVVQNDSAGEDGAAGGMAVAEKVRTQPEWRAPAMWTLVLLVSVGAVYYGLRLRWWAWEISAPVRFVNSVSNAIEWGQYANKVGVLNVYDQLVDKFGTEGDYNGPARFSLDYPPLRLLIAAKWAQWAQANYPPPGSQPLRWRAERAFTEPMLQLNTACELLAALGMFFLVYRWVRLCETQPAKRAWWKLRFANDYGDQEQWKAAKKLPSTVGLWSATMAALFSWFCPAAIFNAHAYPQWDVWLLPAFIWAVYLGLKNWWTTAGILVGVCAMAKGQILFGLPLLIAWPLLRGNLGGALRLVVGVTAGVGAVVWPWMLRDPKTLPWMYTVGEVAGGLALAGLLPRTNWKWWSLRAVLVGAGFVLIWRAGGWAMWPALLALATGAMVLLGSRWWVGSMICTLWAGALAMTVPLFGASLNWYEVGIKYAARHWKHLFWCHGSNLGSILELRFGWRFEDTVDMSWVPWLGLGIVPLRQVMVAAYALTLVFCMEAMARHHRRHDPKLLAVMAAPFLLAYTLMPQMIDRYLMWPAALLSAYAAVSFSGMMLWLTLSVLACVMMLEYMLSLAPQTVDTRLLMRYLSPTFPEIGWAVIILAGTLLALCIAPSTKRTATPTLPA